jgi:hypothetical protein
MMLFPTAIRRDFASMIFRYGPAVVALVYPLALAALHLSGQHFVRATETTNRLLAGFAIFLAAALVYPVPLISFTVISRSDRPRERSLAHLAFAAPPLFTLTGKLAIRPTRFGAWVCYANAKLGHVETARRVPSIILATSSASSEF